MDRNGVQLKCGRDLLDILTKYTGMNKSKTIITKLSICCEVNEPVEFNIKGNIR